MSNQCQHCLYKGDFEACSKAECFTHESWYAKQQQARIKELEEKLEHVENLLIEVQECN